MQDERKRILDMLENGQITAQEAMGLLDALSKQQEQTHTTFTDHQHSTNQSTNRNRDFIEDAKRDFTVIGERVMQMMQGTVDKLRQFDIHAGNLKFKDAVNESGGSVFRLIISFQAE